MYARLKAYARQFLGGLTPELKKYFAEYQRDFHAYQRVSSKKELLSELSQSRIVFCGDYHTLAQAQRTVIRLLRDSLPKLKHLNIKPILAIEMARPCDNKWLDSYLSGALSESEFLAKIQFHKRWGFPWDHYRPLFHFAREHGIRLAGINLTSASGRGALLNRDRFAADVISKLCLEDSKNLVFVLVGDYHLAQSHLPAEMKKRLAALRMNRRTLTIHQNNERLYWKLVERGLEQKVDVVRMKKGVFCVMNTPPWVKLQSHLKWAEMVSAVGGVPSPIRGGDASREFDEEWYDDSVDYSDEVRDLLGAICKFLDFPEVVGTDFTVDGPLILDFVARLKRTQKFSSRRLRLLTLFCAEFESQFVGQGPYLFLKNSDLNHLATQATHYLHFKTSHFSRLFESPKNDFYRFLWVEALGFLGSKIVNHKRKCNGPMDLLHLSYQRAGSKRRREDATVAAFALKVLQKESSGSPSISFPCPPGVLPERRVVFFYKVCKVLGRLLGEALYSAVIDNRVSRREIRKLFRTQLGSAAAARRLYFLWTRRLDEFGYRHVHKREKL